MSAPSGWLPISEAPQFVYGRDALLGAWVDGYGWKKVTLWEREWTRDDSIARGATHWWPHLRDLPSPTHAERLDVLEAENERLRAELATARNDALESAAKVCDKLAQNIYDEFGSTDPETNERMIPTRFMDTVEAYEECATSIRALKDKPL